MAEVRALVLLPDVSFCLQAPLSCCCACAWLTPSVRDLNLPCLDPAVATALGAQVDLLLWVFMHGC